MFDLGGTVRARPAEETLALLRPLLAHYGITRLANVTGLDSVGVPVWMVVRPLARSLTVSQGKGLTHALAMVSGIMESIELYHAEQRRPPSYWFPIDRSFEDETFVNPLLLPLRSDAEFSKDINIRWVSSTEIISGSRRWVPEELFDLDLTAKRSSRPIVISSSNGLASGNTRNEAIVHGICELIERDQISFWLVEKLFAKEPPPRRIALESVCDQICEPMIRKCAEVGLDVFVWYLATTISLPVFACTIADIRRATLFPQRASGFGCHPISRIALARALTEALQSRLTHISGVRDDVTWSRYRNDIPTDPSEVEPTFGSLFEERNFLDFHSIRTEHAESKESLLHKLTDCLQNSGLHEVIVTDFCVETPEISVVHVCIPGIEHNAKKPLYTPGPRMQEFFDGLKAKRRSR